MGEIADAIRRARGQRGTPEGADREGGLAGLVRVAKRSAPPRSDASARGLSVEMIDPHNAAIILAEGPHAEACRHLALRLRASLEARDAHSVAVVSAERGDGKSTIACDLGIALASLSRGRDVAVVDLDLRNPSLGRYLSLTPPVGVEAVLQGEGSLDEARVSVVRPAVDIYTTVTPQRAAHERLVLPSFAELIAELERRYATVIVDTPPVLAVPDASLILRHVDTYACVVRAGKTRARAVRHMMETLPRNQFLGGIVNCESSSRSRYGSYEYYYGPDEDESRSERRRRRRTQQSEAP